MNILFVCTGNICRSPIAATFLKKKYEDNNIEGLVESAGFSPATINEPPAPRAIHAVEKHDIELQGSSRLFVKSDFDKFDKIYVMDTKNYREVKELARNKDDIAKIDYLMNVMHPGKNQTISDPVYSGIVGLDEIVVILDQITDILAEQAKS